MEGELAGNGMITKGALTLSGSPILGVALYRLLTDELSWAIVVPLVVIWAFIFLLLMAFSGRLCLPRSR
jgi:hypothetical protein